MAGLPCKVLNATHVVLGLDAHDTVIPPEIVPFLSGHVVISDLGRAFPRSLDSPTVKAGPGAALGRQHDLGMGAHHLAINALLPAVNLAASSKAEFGVASVRISTVQGVKQLGVAIAPGGVGLQLDCNKPCSMPTGFAFAGLNTVVAGFTPGDLLQGLLSTFCDTLISYFFNMVLGAGLAPNKAMIERMVGQLAGAVVAKLIAQLQEKAFIRGVKDLGVLSTSAKLVEAIINAEYSLGLDIEFPGAEEPSGSATPR